MTYDNDIAVSTRVRLARNLRELPFSPAMSPAQEKQLARRIEDRVGGKDFTVYAMGGMKPVERQMLVERHVASPELAQKKNAVLLLSKDERVSLLVGEEDHVRIQCILDGLCLEEADTLTRAVDALVSAEGYAFDLRLGYLTSCPTNVGTGMRASVMLHLAALDMMGQMQSIGETVGKFGYTMRGFYGEGTTAEGHMYQVSNQITLGVCEEEIISGLNQIVRSLIEKERELRESIFKTDRGRLKDALYRSLGILKYARSITTAEMMQRLSDVKLGLSLGMFEGVSALDVEKLVTKCQPASIEMAIGAQTAPEERDAARAKAVRIGLKDCNVY